MLSRRGFSVRHNVQCAQFFVHIKGKKDTKLFVKKKSETSLHLNWKNHWIPLGLTTVDLQYKYPLQRTIYYLYTVQCTLAK